MKLPHDRKRAPGRLRSSLAFSPSEDAAGHRDVGLAIEHRPSARNAAKIGFNCSVAGN
jgi:hypothetical protein